MPVYLGKEPNDSGDYFFISYKQQDQEVLSKIISKLNFNVWYDLGIEKGAWWPESIFDHLENCKAVIFFVSKTLLAEGLESYPIGEYDVAVNDYHRNVIIVYLDKIDRATDVPNSIKDWYYYFSKKQGISFDGSLSADEIASEIISRVNALSNPENVAPPIVTAPAVTPDKIQMKLYSNFADNSIIYFGRGDVHLSMDMSKLCLYNRNSKKFEVRDMNNPNFVIGGFGKEPDEINAYRLFYSSGNRYIYYISHNKKNSGKVNIYDVERKKWNSSVFLNGEQFKLAKDEDIDCIAAPDTGNVTYLLITNGKIITRVIEYDLENDKLKANWNLAPFKCCSVLNYFHNNSIDWMLFCDADNELRVFDIKNKTVLQAKDIPDFSQIVQNYFEQGNHKNETVDDKLSHDSSLYSVKINGGFSVFSTQYGTKLCDIYMKQYQEVYLLKNETVLSLDIEGNVTCHTFDGNRVIFSKDYFAKTDAFGGNIPHTMLYDEAKGNFIFVAEDKKQDDKIFNKVVVVDKLHRVVSVSNFIHVPFPGYYCQCKLSKGKLIVLFHSPSEKILGGQSTVIYKGEYN